MQSRREFLRSSVGGLLLAGGIRGADRVAAADSLGPAALPSGALQSAQLAVLPGKLPLIKKSFRPPNFETPVRFLNEAFTRNDAFFVRFGDVISAGLVFAGTRWLSFGSRQFAYVNVALIVVWLVLAVAIGRRFERLSETPDPV